MTDRLLSLGTKTRDEKAEERKGIQQQKRGKCHTGSTGLIAQSCHHATYDSEVCFRWGRGDERGQRKGNRKGPLCHSDMKTDTVEAVSRLNGNTGEVSKDHES